MSFDVAIIGAGPAGSTLAALLARRGASVAVLDRDAFPRDKVCGEFLSYDALPLLEQLGAMAEIDRAGAPHIERCRVMGSKHTYEFRFPRRARGVSRLLLDELLLRIASSSGATRMDGVTAESAGAGHVNDIEARVVVGAWGRWGRFDQQLGRAFVRDRRHRSFGFKRHYLPIAVRGSSVDLYSFDRGYLGVNDVEGGATNICGLVHASRLTGHKGRWGALVETLRGEQPALDAMYSLHAPAQEGFLASEPVIFRARSAVERGIFMIGDASGIIDPLTGNGMAMAIQSAWLLAPLVMRLLESPARRPEIERVYAYRHRSFFGARIAWSRRVAMLLARPHLLERALSVVSSPKAGAFLLSRTRASDEAVERLAAMSIR